MIEMDVLLLLQFVSGGLDRYVSDTRQRVNSSIVVMVCKCTSSLFIML